MEEKYTFEHVKAFAIIAFNNLINSANMNSKELRNFKLFLEPLEKLYPKDKVIESAKKIYNIESEKIYGWN